MIHTILSMKIVIYICSRYIWLCLLNENSIPFTIKPSSIIYVLFSSTTWFNLLFKRTLFRTNTTESCKNQFTSKQFSMATTTINRKKAENNIYMQTHKITIEPCRMTRSMKLLNQSTIHKTQPLQSNSNIYIKHSLTHSVTQ